MSDVNPNLAPSVDTPTAQEIALSFVQWAVVALGAAGVALPPLVSSLAFEQTLAGALVLLGTFVWSFIKPYRTVALINASVAASLRAQRPLRVLRIRS